MRPLRSTTLVEIIDGLGHGGPAAAAARTALEVLETAPATGTVTSLFEVCHRALAGTRGVAMSLASVDAAAETLSWLGVGNVEGMLVRARPDGGARRESLVLRGGVVGYRLPRLHASTLPLRPGDTLVFLTDGLERGSLSAISVGAPVQEQAENLLRGFATGNDDALVLVARYLGRPS